MAKKKVSNEQTPTPSTTTAASVYTSTGSHVRTYTREIHGDNFKDLAAQMAAQYEGSRIDVH